MAIKRGRFGYSLTILRIFQFLSFAAIAGLCAVIAAEINRLDAPHQPAPIALALVVSVVTAAYVLGSLLWHVCAHLSYITSTILDIVAMIVVIITAVLVGRPLTRLDCVVVGNVNEHIDSLGDVLYSVGATNSDGVHKFIPNAQNKFQKIAGVSGLESVDGLSALGKTFEEVRSKLSDYFQWVGRVEGTCKMMKAVWGFSILLVFLLLATAVLSYILWRRVHSIRTFHVEENDDGTQVYYTQHVPASVMREFSLDETRDSRAMYEDRRSVDDTGHQRAVVGREAL